MPANKRRGTVDREKALAEVARGYLQGEMLSGIAARLGVVPSQITYDLGILRKRWQQSSAIDMNEAKGKELSKIDLLEQTYWQAWTDSRSERTISSARRKGNTDPETSLRREQRDGNPAFLDGVMKCINKRCEIMGMNAPVKLAPTDPSGEWEYGRLSDDDLHREIVRIFAAFAGTESLEHGGGLPLSLAPPREAEPATS